MSELRDADNFFYTEYATELGNRAVSLANQPNNVSAADAMFKRAIKADPQHTVNLRTYASFLCRERKDNLAAERLYKLALEADPNDAGTLSSYAFFIGIKRGNNDADAAEAMFRRALSFGKELGDKEGMARDYGNLGIVLKTHGDLDGAEAMHRQALAINDKLGRTINGLRC